MKKTAIVLCSAFALALVGCDRDRGGLGSDNNRDTGIGTGSETTYPGRSMPSSTATNGTNAVGAPGTTGGANSGTGGANNSGTSTTP